MAHTHLEATPEQLLQAASQLQSEQLEALVSPLLALKAQRMAPSVSAEETALLLTINQGFPALPRYRELIAKRDAETLDQAEYRELLELTDQAEALQVQRLQALVELAQIRNVPLPELMRTLGLRPVHVG